MLRRLHHTQPASFAFTPENLDWAEAQIAKYPEGRQASAVIPLLWRAQEQEGWVSRPIIETVAAMLGMAEIRVLEVATFYFMFQMKPVGSVAHFQICGTTSCMICGAEDLVAVCKDRIADTPHTLSADGKFSWEEVECLGACSNAPMAQIGKDYYEDLTAERFAEIIDAFAAGEVPTPGPQNGRFASEPLAGLTSLKIPDDERMSANASVALAEMLDDTVARITDGRGKSAPAYGAGGPPPEAEHDPQSRGAVAADNPRERGGADGEASPQESRKADAAPSVAQSEKAASGEAQAAKAASGEARSDEAESKDEADSKKATSEKKTSGHATSEVSQSDEADTDEAGAGGEAAGAEGGPERLDGPREGGADDLKRITGVGPKLEGVLNELGFYHFDQIAAWTKADIDWVDERLKFKGRIERDGWVEQARKLSG